MNINSINGANAYSGVNSSPPVTDTRVSEQNLEASRSTLEPQSTTDAYELSITQEARDRQAREAESRRSEQARTEEARPQETEPPPAEPSAARQITPSQDASQIVNIVA